MPAGRRLVVSIEGPDGSGKSSLVRSMKRLAQRRGQAFTIVGRRGTYANPLVRTLAGLLREQRGVLSWQAELHVRIAREYERARMAAASPPGVVILDRFVLSVLALVRARGGDAFGLLGTFREIVTASHLHATIFVRCPFELAFQRAESRNRGMSLRDTRDKGYLARLAALMEEDFRQGLITRQQWPVDNSGELADAEQQLDAYLAAYFGDEPPAAAEEP
jgi:thymidylate kinase